MGVGEAIGVTGRGVAVMPTVGVVVGAVVSVVLAMGDCWISAVGAGWVLQAATSTQIRHSKKYFGNSVHLIKF